MHRRAHPTCVLDASGANMAVSAHALPTHKVHITTANKSLTKCLPAKPKTWQPSYRSQYRATGSIKKMPDACKRPPAHALLRTPWYIHTLCAMCTLSCSMCFGCHHPLLIQRVLPGQGALPCLISQLLTSGLSRERHPSPPGWPF